MARNGSGTFVRAHDFTDDAAAAIKIRADRMDEEIDGIATALSASIANDGQTTIQADLPMSTHKHTGVGNATARDQYVSVAGLQDGSHNWVAAGGTADAITATYAPALTALVDGQLCLVRASAANATTTPTFAPNGLTAHTITKLGGAALVAGDISGAGHELVLRYKLASTRWELLNPAKPYGATTGTGSVVLSDSPSITTDLTLGSGGTGGGSLYFDINGGSGSGANTGIHIKANGSITAQFYYDVSSGNTVISSGTKDPAITIAGNTGVIAFKAYGAGTLTTDASGNVTASSDETLKDIVGPFSRSTADICKIGTCQWRWNEASKMDASSVQSSYTAQAVQAGIPEAVSTGPDGKLTLFDGAIIAALINAIKDLDGRLKTLGG